MMKILVTFVAVLLAALLVSAEIVTLTTQNFDEIVMDKEKDVFVKFFAPWCGHCVRMQPAWEELSNANTGAVIAEVDVTANEELAEKHGIEGFPTIKLYKKQAKEGVEYNGARDTTALKKFLTENM